MIIKSMSRSSKSFAQLLKYLDKDESLDKYVWNMYANKYNNKELSKEFLENAKYLDKSRGKVYLYHEVIALKNIDIKQAQNILYELANEYINLRAKNHLVFGAIHNDTNNPHIHLIISANEIEGLKRIRLAKKEFAQIQTKLENFKNKHFKELEQTHIYEQENISKSKTKRVEQEMKHKRQKLSKKELLKQDLQDIFEKSQSMSALENSLKNKGYELYIRGSTLGVIFESKKYRLKTLGLEQEYKNTLSKIHKIELRKERRAEFKNSKTRDFEQGRSL